MGLNLDSTGKLQTMMSDFTLTTAQVSLNTNQWYQVTVFYMYSNGRATASIHLGNTLVTPEVEAVPLKALSFTESASDAFKIGGFKGVMRNLNIFGPGSPYLTACKFPFS